MLTETSTSSELPKPTNVWLTGAGGGDFTFLDSLGENPNGNDQQIWACNERTRRGDIIVLYCTSPRSYIHSIWRSNSGGIFNPFDYYHCRTTVCDGILTPHITFKDLKNDEYSIDKYLEVGGDGHVLHVEQVVFEPFAHLVHRAGVAVFDLSP